MVERGKKPAFYAVASLFIVRAGRILLVVRIKVTAFTTVRSFRMSATWL